MAPARSRKEVKVYRVGGSVRDELLGVRRRSGLGHHRSNARDPDRLDLQAGGSATSRSSSIAIPARVRSPHGQARSGLSRVRILRVAGITLAEDLARRDARSTPWLAREGELIDPFGGQADLRAGILARLARVRRRSAARAPRRRFAARFGLRGSGHRAADAHVGRDRQARPLSPERVWRELARDGAASGAPSRGVRAAVRPGLIPEVDAVRRGA
jgi:tRNA nucleotidyltransferase (CCA-adding enzyme)